MIGYPKGESSYNQIIVRETCIFRFQQPDMIECLGNAYPVVFCAVPVEKTGVAFFVFIHG